MSSRVGSRRLRDDDLYVRLRWLRHSDHFRLANPSKLPAQYPRQLGLGMPYFGGLKLRKMPVLDDLANLGSRRALTHLFGIPVFPRSAYIAAAPVQSRYFVALCVILSHFKSLLNQVHVGPGVSALAWTSF